MKKSRAAAIAFVLLLSAGAVAQETSSAKTQVASHKSISIRGTMSEDGRVFLPDADGEVWTVDNPQTLQAYAGREVVIHCRVVPDKKELRVVSVKPVKGEPAYATNWGDSAFRR